MLAPGGTCKTLTFSANGCFPCNGGIWKPQHVVGLLPKLHRPCLLLGVMTSAKLIALSIVLTLSMRHGADEHVHNVLYQGMKWDCWCSHWCLLWTAVAEASR